MKGFKEKKWKDIRIWDADIHKTKREEIWRNSKGTGKSKKKGRKKEEREGTAR